MDYTGNYGSDVTQAQSYLNVAFTFKYGMKELQEHW